MISLCPECGIDLQLNLNALQISSTLNIFNTRALKLH